MERKEMEQAEAIARHLKDIPAARLRVFTDFMQAWSGLSAGGKRSFLNVLQMVADFHEQTEGEGNVCKPLPHFPTKQQVLDVCDWELDEEKKIPGKIVSFHYYQVVIFKQKAKIFRR